MKKEIEQTDESFYRYFFALPALPNFLFAFGLHLYLGHEIEPSLMLSLIAAFTGWFGTLFTIAFYADNFLFVETLGFVFIVGLLALGTIFMVIMSAYEIHKLFKHKKTN